MAGKKTSVYLTSEMQEALAQSGRSLPEVIRTGLGMPPAVPRRAELAALLRELAQDGIFAQVPEPGVDPAKRLVGTIMGVDPEAVRDSPKLRPAAPQDRRPMPALDRRITQATDELISSWSQLWTSKPAQAYIDWVKEEVRSLLEQGVVPADIDRGLSQWYTAADSDPAQISGVVERVMEEGMRDEL